MLFITVYNAASNNRINNNNNLFINVIFIVVFKTNTSDKKTTIGDIFFYGWLTNEWESRRKTNMENHKFYTYTFSYEWGVQLLALESRKPQIENQPIVRQQQQQQSVEHVFFITQTQTYVHFQTNTHEIPSLHDIAIRNLGIVVARFGGDILFKMQCDWFLFETTTNKHKQPFYSICEGKSNFFELFFFENMYLLLNDFVFWTHIYLYIFLFLLARVFWFVLMRLFRSDDGDL